MRPDKKKVVDERWDDERVRSFLTKGPFGQERSADYSCLIHAYRSMRAEDFERFLGFFLAEGRDLDACSSHGQTLSETIAGHAQATPFLAALDRARASRTAG
ncbi:MAG: PA4642 family protein [Pseudomonadota bacterium]